MTTCSKVEGRKIELSLGTIDYSGTQTAYIPATTKTADLQQVFTAHNYSPIIWDNNYRLTENYLRATGFCVDNDQGLTIPGAQGKLEEMNQNFALITTRSHTDAAHRFRIFLPFSRTVQSYSDYLRIAQEITREHFPSCDPRVLDGARQLYASPKDATFISCWDRKDYDVDAKLTNTDGQTRVQNAWTEKLQVRGKDGRIVLVRQLNGKTIIHCPFHNDSNESAFLEYSKSSDNYFISCSACGKTFWKEKVSVPLEELCRRFYSHSVDILEVGFAGDEFYLAKINQKKFWVFTNAREEAAKSANYEFLVKEKHIPHLKRIDHVGDLETDQSYFEFDRSQGLLRAHYAALPAKIQDNAFIENWIAVTFRIYKDFIKRWVAVYCHTNYQKLSTLILKGERGTGKNTFADAIMAIFPSISQYWHGEEKNFTPEVQKKLLIADESVSGNEKQYKMLKARSGQRMSVVNQKFLPEYQVRNNMNIIILSNEVTPIFAQKDEEPTSERNNQFFVYEMPRLKVEIDPQFGEKIEERLGHYIRTELKAVYESVKDIPGCRYSIPTPITDYEKALYNVNQTGLEEEGMKFLRKMVERQDPAYSKFFVAGLFPTKFLDEYSISKGYTKNGVIRILKEKGWLQPVDPVRKMIQSGREYCFLMTDKLKMWYRKEKSVQ